MSESKAIAPWVAAVQEARQGFLKLADAETYEKESLFAYQAVQKNNYLQKIANERPDYLRMAVINVAAIGLTLNPALQYAYIVPRDGIAILDVSYKGLLKLATDSGAIKWAQAELVYSNDTFEYRGPSQEPLHSCNPFSGDRGEFQGGYCIAKTVDDDILVEVMTATEIHEIRDRSELYKKKKMGPWVDFFGEMAKKTLIKRAQKTWPKSSGGRLEKAIEILNESGEGIEFKQNAIEIQESFTVEQQEQLQKCLDTNDSLGVYIMSKVLTVSQWTSLYNMGGDKQKIKVKERIKLLEREGSSIFDLIVDACHRGDIGGISENLDGCDPELANQIPFLMDTECAAMYRDLSKELA